MYRSENISDLIAALTKAKKTISNPRKIKKSYTNSYAPLDEVLACIEPSLSENGLYVTHDRDLEKSEFVTYVFHTSGQFISTKAKVEFKVENKMNFMQSQGSSTTYAMRYNLLALFNLCGEDDDDGVASGEKRFDSEKDRKIDEEKKKTFDEEQQKHEKSHAIRKALADQISKMKETRPTIKTDVLGFVSNSNPKLWTDQDVRNVTEFLQTLQAHEEVNYDV